MIFGGSNAIHSKCQRKVRYEESDQVMTSFITPYGLYCYVTMPFGLKNFGATYQRCMQRCFTDQIDPPDQPD